MSFALLFAVLMLLWLISFFWSPLPNTGGRISNIILFILLLLLGWKVFGPLVHP